MKLIVEYSEKGDVVPDLKVAEWLDDLLNKLVDRVGHTMTINIGAGIMFDAIRVAILQERLNHEDVTVKFKEQTWQLDKNGRSGEWPNGFCDTHDTYLEQLLGA